MEIVILFKEELNSLREKIKCKQLEIKHLISILDDSINEIKSFMIQENTIIDSIQRQNNQELVKEALKNQNSFIDLL